MHFVRSWEPVIMMKTIKANFCTQAATLAQSYTSPSSSKQFSGTFFEPSVYCLHQLTAGSLQWKRSLFYVQVGWKKWNTQTVCEESYSYQKAPYQTWQQPQVAIESCYLWFTPGYTYNEIFGLLFGFSCGTCYIAIFCSALEATLGNKEACFWWLRRVVQHSKIREPWWFRCATFNIYPHPAVLHELEKPQNSLPASSWWADIDFLTLVAFCCYVWHPHSPLFALNLLTCCATWTRSMRIQCTFSLIHFRCALKAHHNELHVNVP